MNHCSQRGNSSDRYARARRIFFLCVTRPSQCPCLVGKLPEKHAATPRYHHATWTPPHTDYPCTMCESSMSSLLCAAFGSAHLSPFACRRLFWSRLAAPHHHCLRTPAVVPLDCALSRSGSRSVMRSTTRVEIRVPVPFPQVRRGSSRAPGQLGQRQRVRLGDRRDNPHACMLGVSRAHGQPWSVGGSGRRGRAAVVSLFAFRRE